MKQTRFLLCVCLTIAFLSGSAFVQAQSLTIGDGSNNNSTIPITMSSDADVEGFVLSISYDTSKITATDIQAVGATLANDAELVVPEILADGATLGVVLDFSAPYDGQVIPAGDDVLIAELTIATEILLPCGEQDSVDIVFEDGLNSPPLSNIVVANGLSSSASEGLVLNNGSFTIVGTCSPIRVVSTNGAAGDTTVEVPVEVDNQQALEGYVLSIQQEAGITLESIMTAGTDADSVGIEFQVAKVYPEEGGTLGVVFDFDPPYDGQALEPGMNQTIAICAYSIEPFECTGEATDTKTFALTFVDGVFGSPALSNVLVSAGLSVAPTTENGEVSFACEEPAGIDFYVGADTGGDNPEIIPATGTSGTEAKVSLYYTSDFQPIQGISMALSYPTDIQVAGLDGAGQGIVSDMNLEGTITEGINAEFVSFNAEAGELIVGILVDSTPPVPLEHMYPPSATVAKVLNIYFAIPEGAPCNTVYDLTFENGITGAGVVPISNRAAVLNESVAARLNHGSLVAGGSANFIRGDCNSDQIVDIADPAATMSYLYLRVFDPSCMDACDSNDDGVVDLADVVSTLRFLFQLGEELPAPGPYTPGVDPTEDIYGLDLGCVAGDPCDDE